MKESSPLTWLRQICLGLPEVRETVKWGHPTFEAGKRMFAVLDQYEGRTCIAFRTSPEKRDALLTDKRYFEAPYAAGLGWICLHADVPFSRAKVQALLLESYRLVALKRMLSALNNPGKPQEPAKSHLLGRVRGGRRA